MHNTRLIHDYNEFTRCGGKFFRLSKAVLGDKSSGKYPPKGFNWNAMEKGLTLEEVQDVSNLGYNLGVLITSAESSLVCIDCDADTPDQLLDGEDNSEFFKENTLTIYRSDSELRYKAIYNITDVKNLHKLSALHHNDSRLKCEYEVFLSTENGRYIVVAPSIHGLNLGQVISNGKDIANVTTDEFAGIVKRIVGVDISVKDTPINIPSKNIAKSSGEKELPDIGELMRPYLKNIKTTATGWVNGVITDGDGINAGYHIASNSFKVWASKGKFANTSGGAITFYALEHDINPADKKSIVRQLIADGYVKPADSAFDKENEHRDELKLQMREEVMKEERELLNESISHRKESALEFVENTIKMKHTGDESEIRLMLLISMLNKIKNSRGIILFVGGETGSGKSDLGERLADVLHPEFVNKMNVSPAALWYSTPLPHTHMIIDEGAIYDEFQMWMKLTTSNWDKAEKRMVTIKQASGENTAQEYYTPIRTTIYNFRYESTGDEQIQDRSLQITLQVNEKKLHDVRAFQLRQASNPDAKEHDEYTERLKTCHTIYGGVPLVTVKIPFAERIIEDPNFATPRMRRHYLGLICSICLWRNIWKTELVDNMVLEATEEDFWQFVDLIGKLEDNKSFIAGERAGISTSLREFIFEHDWENEKECFVLGKGKYCFSLAGLARIYNGMSKTGLYYALYGRGGKSSGLISKIPELSSAEGESVQLPDGTVLRSNAKWIIFDSHIVSKNPFTGKCVRWGLEDKSIKK